MERPIEKEGPKTDERRYGDPETEKIQDLIRRSREWIAKIDSYLEKNDDIDVGKGGRR